LALLPFGAEYILRAVCTKESSRTSSIPRRAQFWIKTQGKRKLAPWAQPERFHDGGRGWTTTMG
jgi:hypothetical protein